MQQKQEYTGKEFKGDGLLMYSSILLVYHDRVGKGTKRLSL